MDFLLQRATQLTVMLEHLIAVDGGSVVRTKAINSIEHALSRVTAAFDTAAIAKEPEAPADRKSVV